MKTRIIFSILVLVSSIQWLNGAVIKGNIKDRMADTPIEGALVVLENPENDAFKMESLSDESGQFIIKDVPAGKYKLAALKEGFFSNSLFDFVVEPAQRYDVAIKLLHQKGKWNAEYCFMIGGIEVKAVERDVIPEEMVTVRRIDSGEIEHLQADNLGDVLTLIPGVEKSRQIGLSNQQSVGIRQVASGSNSLYGNATFGTTIMVDGNEINNDASVSGMTSSMAGGLDLRTIPADNIASVEVITGIPSVEYGNFADGVIKVETKKGARRSRIKAKFNPDTKGLNYSGGRKMFKTGNLDIHANYAYSERDIRKIGDEYHRFYFDGIYSNESTDKRFKYALNGSYTKTLDDEKPTDVTLTQSHNHGYLAATGFDWSFKPAEVVTYDGNINVDMKRKHNYKNKMIYEQLNDSTFSYRGEMWEEGREWDLTYKIKRIKEVKKLNGNEWKNLFGVDLNYQENTGSGVHIDSILNYYGVYSTQRSYSFDDYPGFAKMALYGEHSHKWKLNKRNIEWMVGLRYDAINVKGFDIGSHSFLNAPQGEFLSPRFNTRIELADGLFWRIGAGRSIKSVSLSHIYKPSSFVKVNSDTGWVEVEYDQKNYDLHGYPTDKAETSIDWKISDLLGLTLTSYYSETENQIESRTYPDGYEINPDSITAITYSKYQNVGWNIKRGVELTIQSKRIRDLKFVFNATYRNSLTGKSGLSYDSTVDPDWQAYWVPAYRSWQEKVILGQQTSYINQRLGVWLTLDVQYIPLDKKRTRYQTHSIFTEIDDHYVEYFQGMTYWYDGQTYDFGNHWVMNCRVSKSMGQNTEVSLYVNNLFDDDGLWTNPFSGLTSEMNVPIYYGLEVSTQW